MNIFKCTLTVCFILLLAGCSEDFITLAPVSNANEQTFFRNEDDFVNAIYGGYSTLQRSGTYSDYMQLVGDLRSDNTEMGTTASVRFPFFELSEFRVQETSPIVENIWNDQYLGIVRVNTILNRLEEASVRDSFRERIEGEARFLRALFHFNLVRVFGDVPLLAQKIETIEEAYEYGRTESTLIYDQIVEDLIFAEQTLPIDVTGEEGRASKGAAAALLGKVYLTIGDYTSARDILATVINSNQYELLENYSDLWKAENKNHKESVFDVQFMRSTSESTGASFTDRYTPYQYPHLPYSTTSGGYNIPTEDLVAAYEENDVRKEASLRESFVNTDGSIVSGLEGRFLIKFHDMPTQGAGSDDNWPVLRYADVLLMYAEALNEISFEANGNAFNYLNQIRSRAGLPPKSAGHSAPALSVDNQQEFRLGIEQERRVELAFEGHRWFDLVRTGRAIEVLETKVSAGVQQYQLVLPLPLSQIEVNPEKLTQNPGYK